jgi:hypothetical protein
MSIAINAVLAFFLSIVGGDVDQRQCPCEALTHLVSAAPALGIEPLPETDDSPNEHTPADEARMCDGKPDAAAPTADGGATLAGTDSSSSEGTLPIDPEEATQHDSVRFASSVEPVD